MAGAGARGSGPLGTKTNRPIVDGGTLARTSSPQSGHVGGQNERQEFDRAFDLLKAEIANTGFTAAADGSARANYDRLLREFRDEIYSRVMAGKLTWREASKEAHGVRDHVMQLVRRRSTPVGRASAEKLKPTSSTLNELIAKKTAKLFGSDAKFASLAADQKNHVYAAIVESAGKSNESITPFMRKVSRGGRGLLVLSLSISVYTIATADDKVDAVKHEGAVTAAGIAGGTAGGALAGLACGPGAPVCVTIGAFVGGAMAAFGTDLIWAK
ncbi:MAG: hypothetical protein KF778_02245 [Rhodocyclaceae bacterium]|nr:hypothetical protein [Rhodocyclaceae bacterium]MBX3667195.1 hypothetical protein [Rhodocyclaceae bacterium]